MKKEIHPEYKEVIFLDMSTGKKFLCRSAVKTHETVDFEGKNYPCMKVSISSDSHPFYTGDKTFVDSEGRVDKFKKRYAKAIEPVKAVEKEAEEGEKEPKGKKGGLGKNVKVIKEAAPVKEKVALAKKTSAKSKEPKA